MHKVLIGSASDAEIAELQGWIDADPANREEFEDMKILYRGPQQIGGADGDLDSSWQRIQAAINRFKRRARWINLLKVLGIATGVYATIVFVYGVFSPTHRRDHAPTGNVLASTIHFKDAPISDVLHVIKSNAKWEVTLVSGELATYKFTGSFKRGTSYRDMLETLARAKDLNILYISDQSVVLSAHASKAQ